MLLNLAYNVSDHENHDCWEGIISEFNDLGSFQRVVIEAYGSRLDVLCGECPSYRWVFLPELEIGCMQASLSDFFWNSERLSRILNRKDALSIVYGLHFILARVKTHG